MKSSPDSSLSSSQPGISSQATYLPPTGINLLPEREPKIGRSRVRIVVLLIGVFAGRDEGIGEEGGVGKGGGLTDTMGTFCRRDGGGERGAKSSKNIQRWILLGLRKYTINVVFKI